MNTNTPSFSSQYALAEVQATFMRRVYAWMSGGVFLTAIVANLLVENTDLMHTLLSTRYLFQGIIFGQLALVIGLSWGMNRLSAMAATLLYLAYSALTGVTLSVIFLVYTQESIAGIFLTTAFAFAGLTMMGYTTKKDLGPIGAFCGMALFGLVGWGLLSLFFPSMMGGQAEMIYSVIGVFVFAGLTAYDTQKIKAMGVGLDASGGLEMVRKGAIFGALMLYLDFINLFLSLLRLAGRRR